MDNPHLFKDKVVLDIGAGTGILSMFAAKAGAARVYAVECSGIADQCSQIIADNGFSDVITVLKGKMEEVALEHEFVDVIISEWMGYMLLYESMLDTVLWARDKYLRPGSGAILPDKAILYICAIEDRDYRHDKIDFWDNVYGFNFKCIKTIALAEPLVDNVNQKLIVTNSKSILTLDLLSCTKEDLAYSSNFSLKCLRADFIHAFVVYWDCFFTMTHREIKLSTSPFSRGTHWKQTVFYLKSSVAAQQDEEVTGTISCRPNGANVRDLDIFLRYAFQGALCSVKEEQFYRLR